MIIGFILGLSYGDQEKRQEKDKEKTYCAEKSLEKGVV